MGADLIVMTLPTYRARLDVSGAAARMRALAEQETDHEVLMDLCEYVGLDYDTLALEVALADDEAREAMYNAVEGHFRREFENLRETFDWRDVSCLTLGDVWLMVTGGMSYGDDPTETFAVWNRLLDPFYEPGYGKNPYAEDCWEALGLLGSPKTTIQKNGDESNLTLEWTVPTGLIEQKPDQATDK